MSWLPTSEYVDWWYDLSWKGIIAFGAIAAVATAATVVFTVIQFWSDGIRDDRAEQRNRAMELQVATANSSAAEANRKAESEKLERAKLEASIAPRSLGLEMQKAYSEAWKKFAGRRVRVVSYSLDMEAAQLGEQVIASMKSAGIIVVDDRANLMPLGGFAVGILIEGTDTELVVALAQSFIHAGLADITWDGTKASRYPPGADGPDAASVLIGVKPLSKIK